jgi:hypothetical protein
MALPNSAACGLRPAALRGNKSPWRKAAPIWVFSTQLGFFDVRSIDGFYFIF